MVEPVRVAQRLQLVTLKAVRSVSRVARNRIDEITAPPGKSGGKGGGKEGGGGAGGGAGGGEGEGGWLGGGGDG